jgi:transposase
MGFRVSQQLTIVQAVFQLLKHIQYTYSCPKYQGEIITAEKPEQPFGKGYANAALVAHIGNAKFNWHLPLYRQEQIYRAQTVPIARSNMSRWLREGAEYLQLIVERMHQLLLQSRYILSDTTAMPVIKKGLGQTHKGVIWIARGDDTSHCRRLQGQRDDIAFRAKGKGGAQASESPEKSDGAGQQLTPSQKLTSGIALLRGRCFYRCDYY